MATKAADSKYDTDNTMDQPEIKYDVFPTMDNAWINDPKSYCALSYILFDPLSQFHATVNEKNIITCPKCKSDSRGHLMNTRCWKNGRLERLNPRIIFDLTSSAILVYKQYSCSFGHREINAVDVDVLKQIDNCYVPFALIHKSGFTNRLVDYLEKLLDTGLSSRQICEVIRRCYKKAYYERAQRYYHDYNVAKHIGIATEPQQNFPTFEEMGFPCVGQTLVRGAVISKFKSEEVQYQQFF